MEAQSLDEGDAELLDAAEGMTFVEAEEIVNKWRQESHREIRSPGATAGVGAKELVKNKRADDTRGKQKSHRIGSVLILILLCIAAGVAVWKAISGREKKYTP